MEFLHLGCRPCTVRVCYLFSLVGFPARLHLFGVELAAAQGPSIQSVALAATKSGATGADIVALASFGNFGRQPHHIAEQLTLKYCKTSSYHLPSPYIADVPVLVKSNVDCNVSVQMKPIALFLPHDWLAWMGGPALDEDVQELVAGFGHANGFWSDHDMSDPSSSTIHLERKGGFCTLPPHGCACRRWCFSKK